MKLKFNKVKFSDLSSSNSLRFDNSYVTAAHNKIIDGNIRITKIAKLFMGKEMNQEYLENNSGDYPVYSSQTSNDGLFGYIDSYDYDGEYVTWTTRGVKAGTTFYRTGQFSCTSNCGLIKVDNSNYYPKFFFFFLNTILKYYTSKSSGIPMLTYNMMKDVYVVTYPKKIQEEFIQFIIPLEKEMADIKKQLIDNDIIINDVFSDYFKYDKKIINKIHKGMTFGTQKNGSTKMSINKLCFKQLTDNKVRLSTRVNNPILNEVYKIINLDHCLLVKDVLKEPMHRGKSPKYDSKGTVPVIKTAHVTNNGISNEFVEFVSDEFYDNKIDAQVHQNDLLLTSTGKPSIGKIDIVNNDDNAVADGHITIIRIDEKKYNPLFFMYYIRSILGYAQLEKEFVGCTNQVELYCDSLNNLYIPDISLDLQNEIVKHINTEINKQNAIREKIDKIMEIIDNKVLEKKKKKKFNN